MNNSTRRYFIPENLDVKKLIEGNQPLAIKEFKVENMLHIINLITSIPAANKDLELMNGYTPINAKILQNKVRNYRLYLDYLIENKVIQSDNRYVSGKKSTGYKFTRCYSGKVKCLSRLSKKPQSVKAVPKKIRTKYEHLFNWYNPMLQIDVPSSMQFISSELDKKVKNKYLLDYDEKSKSYKDPYRQYNCALANIEKISAGEFSPFVDSNVNRLHSTITNLHSSLRNFISYNGLQLVSVDVRNCQPYLSTLVLQSSFWDNRITGNCIHVSDVYPDYINIFYNSSQFNSFVMLCKYHETSTESDTHRYRRLVHQGLFYEYFEHKLKEKLNRRFKNRKAVKMAVFQVLFTDNRFLGQSEAAAKRIFRDVFPCVYELFRLIKKKASFNLPRLLQRIESHSVLLKITKRISHERPDLPIFTIHDSVITTSGNEDYVKSIMEEEMEKAIGSPPQLKIDTWSANIDHLQSEFEVPMANSFSANNWKKNQ